MTTLREELEALAGTKLREGDYTLQVANLALEAAAKSCDSYAFYEDDPAGYANQCAAAIRAMRVD